MRIGQTPTLPQALIPTVVSRVPVPADPFAATALTLAQMRSMAMRSASTPTVQRFARQITNGAVSPREKAERIFWWVKRNIAFREDPPDAELLQDPELLLTYPNPAGDCDDHSMLNVALLGALGLPADFVTVGEPHGDCQPSHVYARALLPSGPLAMDTSHGAWPGWEAEQTRPICAKQTWQGLAGLRPLGQLCPDGLPPDSDTGCGAGGGSSFGNQWWSPLINAGVNVGTQITSSLFPIPTYQQRGPSGSVTVYGQPGAGPVTLGPTTIPGWLWIVGGGLLIFAVAKGASR